MNIPSIYRVNKNNQLMVSRMSEPSTVYNYILLVWGDPQPKPSLATGVGWVGDFVVGGSSIATPAKKKHWFISRFVGVKTKKHVETTK